MNKLLEKDFNSFDKLLHKIAEQGTEYFKNVDLEKTSLPVLKTSKKILNNEGIGGLKTLKLFNEKFRHTIVASSGPRYLGYVVGGTTPAAVIGDWLTTIYDQNPQTTTAQGDVSVQIEQETIKLLLHLFHLPNNFLGGFVSGATMSNFTCLAVARQWIGKQEGKDFAKNGITSTINVLSAVPHSSAIKSLSMLGIGSANVIKIKIEEGNRESININDLEVKIKTLNNKPFILISSAGTVNSADFDNFEAINALHKKYNFWWHIDGAFGAFASCSPKYRHLVKGWENADSITIDCHKWLNVPYDSAVFFVKEKHNLLQLETFQNSNAPYLGDPSENFNYLNFLPENSRRLRALPAWFSLIAYGKDGYKDIVENSVNMAQKLEEFILQNEELTLLTPTRLNNVCFSLKDKNKQDKIPLFITELNKEGKVYMTPTVYRNTKGVRASFVNWRTNEKDILIITKEIEKALKYIK
ncbi:pyridoxal phosphate-dependent decarboxylase family protein [Cellulophaga omnivescoria]|uniref:pyridoxal phosphate-dependent decarboxylase family protein n=1 Tax=Cellulophaga omnivescoria TaxID=1888890 RepID=UPI000985CAFD|nr:pyridoxal-dependent decarboxylase [Cellulophaga omnivescoria]WKB80087.1 pyridoxal-dependent decarboxylase [Cellulophaga lytica]